VFYLSASGKDWIFAKSSRVTLRDKVRNCEIRKALRIERSQLRWFGHVSRMLQERLARQVLLATFEEKYFGVLHIIFQ